MNHKRSNHEHQLSSIRLERGNLNFKMGTKSNLLGNVKSSNHFTNTSTFFKTRLMYNLSTITTLNFWFLPFGNMVQRKVANPTDITRDNKLQ